MRPFRAALLAALLIVGCLTPAAHAAPPAVVVDGPAQVTTGTPASFDASATRDPDGDALAFDWTIDGQSVGVHQDWLSVSFAHPSTHVVAVTVTDATGATSSRSLSVAVTGADRTASSVSPLGVALLPSVVSVPDLVLTPSHVRLRHHRLRVELRCRGVQRCSGTVRAVALLGPLQRPLRLAQRRFMVTRGAPRVVHLRLGPRARRWLRRHRLVRVTAYRGPVRVVSLWATSAFHVPIARRRHARGR